MVIKRGDIFYADLRPVVGSEQGGIRPVLIIQNDVGNRHSPTVICEQKGGRTYGKRKEHYNSTRRRQIFYPRDYVTSTGKEKSYPGNYYRPGSARETDRNGGQIGRQHFDI